MKTFCLGLSIVLMFQNENGSVTGTTLCCPIHPVETEDFVYAAQDFDDASSESIVTTADLSEIVENLTRVDDVKNNQTSRLCGTEVTNVYERKHDIDMRYVQDSITALWRIIFSLIFILILLVFLISYVSSLIQKNNMKKSSTGKIKKYTDSDIPIINKSPQLYFPVINGSRTANFLKDLDPIYDYPCSLRSEYERV